MASLKQRIGHRSANPIESASGSDKNFMRSEVSNIKQTVNEQLSGTSEDFISQLLGINNNEKNQFSMKGGEMKIGESIDFTKKQKDNNPSFKSQVETKSQEKRTNILSGYDYRNEIVHGSETLSRKEASELDKRIEQILVEIKRLIGSSTILSAEFAIISVEEKPQEAGKYYVNFFEWLLIEIKKIRVKVEDAGAWLSVMKSKKSQRKYGKMAKKHGTSFTLSNERTTATQTG